MYNLPLDEMMEVADYALTHGYTVCWDGDVSEKVFIQNGVAINPVVKKRKISRVPTVHILKNGP